MRPLLRVWPRIVRLSVCEAAANFRNIFGNSKVGSAKALKLLDAFAVAMCRDNQLPIVVVNLNVFGISGNRDDTGAGKRAQRYDSASCLLVAHSSAACPPNAKIV
ncbi:MAG: hypothetical protein ACLPWF_07660 [Bryobacteraceae bacterium]